jgi:DNA-binding transcriptional LysR family regulator
MLELYEKGFIEFKQRTISTTNKLHISLPAVFQNSVFTHHLAAFIKEYPDVFLNISIAIRVKISLQKVLMWHFALAICRTAHSKHGIFLCCREKWWHQSNCYAITNLSTT